MNPNTARALSIWLYGVAALIALMVLVGGATRLTGSGLSITEWKPVAGMLPPLNEGQWQNEFNKYQATTQYKELNRGMSLSAFKKIYWWEWTHRFLGRLIAVAFALPLLLFAITRDITRPLMIKLGAILGLGALQGAIGWWMVASGLADRINVVPFRLAVHLTLALIIFAAVLQVAVSLRPSTPHLTSPLSGGKDETESHQNSLPLKGGRSGWGSILLPLIFMQVFFGGLVAGTRAGYAYNTWPLMDGGIIPSGMFVIEPWWRNFFENTALVQFLHRMTAYALMLTTVFLYWRMPSKENAILLGAILAQAGLGIATLLSEMNFGLALAHQAGVILVLWIVIRPLPSAPDPDRR